jgi:tetraacyldisaccharide 4'-kinase
MNIKKFFVQLVSAGKPTIPAKRDLIVLLRYGVRYAIFMLLSGCSLIYGSVVHLRIVLYRTGIFKQYMLSCPVISIGNITTGGTGKTPMVILIAQIFRQYGKRVVVLSRGYQRQGKAPYSLVEPHSDVQIAGDEPLLIARKTGVPVIVGKRRSLAGQFALERFQPEVILLDDGFQHLQLTRTVDIVLIDAANPFGGDYLLPAGLLREPVANLARAHAFVITRSDEVDDITPICQRLRRLKPDAPIFTGMHVYEGITSAQTGESVSARLLKATRLIAVSGIANPASFHRLCTQIGLIIVAYRDFPDHHWYTDQDMSEMRQIIAINRLAGIIKFFLSSCV